MSLVIQESLNHILKARNRIDKQKTKKEIKNKPVSATVKYVRVSPFKLRKVANEIRGKSAVHSLKVLKVMTQKSAGILYKLLKSAVANAVENNKLEENLLVIDKLIVNQGPVMKRIQPRARGRAFRIIKPTSHATITLISTQGAN